MKFYYTPKKNDRSGTIIPLLLFLVSALAVGFSVAKITATLPLQLIALICIISAIQIFIRYGLSVFTYSVTNESNGDFSVVRVQGKRSTEVCNIALQSLVAVEKKEKSKKLAEIYGKPDNCFNFCNNLFPVETYIMIIKFNDKLIYITIEPDEELLNYLAACIDSSPNSELN